MFCKNVTLLSLSNDIQWPELLSHVEHLGITIDSDKLYDEFCVLRKVHLELISSNSNVVDRWVKFFASLQPEYTEMLRVVSYLLSIPVSNANCERVFSIMNGLCTDSRNRMGIDVVKVELMIKINFHLSCNDFYELIHQHRELLQVAVSGKI